MRVSVFSSGIRRLPFLDGFFQESDEPIELLSGADASAEVVVGWGRKDNTRRAIEFAKSRDLPYLTLEDGFIRSLGTGREGAASISLVVDPIGIYYDATRPSQLECTLNSEEDILTDEIEGIVERSLPLLIENRISKYNGDPDIPSEYIAANRKNVLVIDQVRGDMSLKYGMSEDYDLEEMVRIARSENPDAKIYIKLHPETVRESSEKPETDWSVLGVTVLDKAWNPLSILSLMDKIYVATSQLGFEALLLGKNVVCFGMPFYAGWGVTDDRSSCPRRTRLRTVREIFAAAYIGYSRYVDPVTGKKCDIVRALEVILQQVTHEQRRSANIFCFGIRHWKRYNVLPFLSSRYNKVEFVKSVSSAIRLGIKKGDDVVVWGAREPEGLGHLLELTGTELLRMEDGFLRSVGLGSDFIRPSSLVLDRKGIYFDPSSPSELEHVLNTAQFDSSLLYSARRVREKLVAARLSKYNHVRCKGVDVAAAGCKRIIFIPGQVADDASIAKGCIDVSDNSSLIRAVREANPEAYIIFKPHPDVSSGNRKGKVSNSILQEYCDQIVINASIPDCLDIADEVHTMTSLVGFEALLRKIPVHVYGRPFYCGWGLTMDRHLVPGRTRQLTLDQLVAGALLVYPEYYDWDSGFFTDCERIIDKLSEQKTSAEMSRGLQRLEPGYLERQVRKMILIIKGFANVH